MISDKIVPKIQVEGIRAKIIDDINKIDYLLDNIPEGLGKFEDKLYAERNRLLNQLGDEKDISDELSKAKREFTQQELREYISKINSTTYQSLGMK